jgi:hypothetical protein
MKPSKKEIFEYYFIFNDSYSLTSRPPCGAT